MRNGAAAVARNVTGGFLYRRALAVPLFLFAIAFALAGTLLGQTDYDQPDETLPGFKATNVYDDFGSVDHVSVYSGDTGIVIPLGPEYPLSQRLSWQLKAYYSAKMWTFDAYCTSGGAALGHGVITGYPTLGAGWTLDVGHIGKTKNGMWFFQSPDGGRHDFAIGPLASTTTQYVTWDTTHERVTWYPASSYFTVEFPQGGIQYFEHAYTRPVPLNGDPAPDFNDQLYGAPPDTRWGLTRYVDQFGSLVLQVNYTGTEPWLVTSIVLTPNGTPRTIAFNWSTYQVTNSGPSITGQGTLTLSPVWRVLQSISFPTVGGGALTTTFTFNPGTFKRNDYFDGVLYSGCGADSFTPSFVAVPLLSSIAVSGHLVNQTWSFTYNDQYPSPWPFGALTSLQLPTSGKIQYAYDVTTYDCPIPSCSGPSSGSGTGPAIGSGGRPDFFSFFDATPAVISRSELNRDGSLLSRTTYDRFDYWVSLSPFDYSTTQTVRQVRVHRPGGNGNVIADRYLFHVSLSKSLVSTDTTSGLELVHYFYNQDDVPPMPPPTPIRAVVSCSDTDSISGCGYATGSAYSASTITPYSGSNARPQKRVTWYGDNPASTIMVNGGDCSQTNAIPCWQSAMLDYNGTAGEYGTEEKSSNTQLLLYLMNSRTTKTHWTPNVDASHWLLKLFDWKRVDDNYTGGQCAQPPCLVLTNYGFNWQNGFLNTVSVFDPPDGSGSVLRRAFQPDGAGNPINEVLSANSLDGSLTGFFVTNRTFQNGLALTSQRDLIPWKKFDVTRDTNTGLITKSRDPNASLETLYEYDTLGRLTKVSPPGAEAPTTYCYSDWSAQSPGQPAYVLAKKGAGVACSVDDGVPATGSGSFEAYQFDPFGRLQREVRRMPNALSTMSYLSFQETRYDFAGHRSFLSEWTPCGLTYGATDVRSCFATAAATGTTWSNFDFLGRPRQIVAADGSVTTKSFDDPSGLIPNSDFTELVTQIRTYTDSAGQTVTGPLTGGSRKDILGRTLLVAEAGPAPFGPVTHYEYNTLDKLTSVDVTGSGVQPRTFNYDLFGFLRSETHPEKGTTSHSAIDALGNRLRSTEPDGTVIARTYDPAGRLTVVLAGGQKYSVDCYDGAAACADGSGGFGGGSSPLGKLTRRYGWNPMSASQTSIVEDFTYSALGGRVSDKTTSFSAGTLASVTEHWFYDSLGLLRQHDHPKSAGSVPFVVSTLYASARPVAEYADGLPIVTDVAYLPSGGLATYTAGHHVGHDLTTTIDPDDALLPRPKRIRGTEQASGATLFDTGVYAYDPVGNPTAIGSDVFQYDGLSRLTFATYAGVGSSSFTYDAYGNLLSKGAVSYTVDPARNQLSAPYAYNGRGDLISNGTDSYGYDLLDRQVSHTSQGNTWNYLFAGDGERLIRALPSFLGDPVYTLRDEKRRVSAEYVGAVASRDDVYLGKWLVASYANVAAGAAVEPWHFHSSDHLGTPRLDVGMAGNVIDRNKYWPFGDEVAFAQTSQRVRFAGMERDSESSRYYDHARSHDFAIGRFASVDAVNGHLLEPQSWNRYTYAQNRPLTLVDADGREPGKPQYDEFAAIAGPMLVNGRLVARAGLKEGGKEAAKGFISGGLEEALAKGKEGFLRGAWSKAKDIIVHLLLDALDSRAKTLSQANGSTNVPEAVQINVPADSGNPAKDILKNMVVDTAIATPNLVMKGANTIAVVAGEESESLIRPEVPVNKDKERQSRELQREGEYP